MSEHITLKRNCEAVLIPSGERTMLTAGSTVRITQSLGGSYTVTTHYGQMARIEGKDADAIGKEALKPAEPQAPEGETPIKDLVWNALRTCYDPEIPVNIVELGLIYECQTVDHPEGGKKVDVRMTLTAPGCGMGASIAGEAQAKILRIPGVKEAKVELVWNPPWDQSKMSEAAKLQLGM
jgi:probable FeS assembly SUF system protein SufT